MTNNQPETMYGPSVLLVSMPWTNLTEPSLGLSVLRAVLDEKNIPCRVMHLNLFLLEHLRAHSYYALANIFSLNDFLFSGVFDSAVSQKQRQWLHLKTQDLLSYGLIDDRQYGGLEGVVQKLLQLRQDVVPNWLTHWADEIARSNATLVGFTCMFDQTIASAALAYLLKQRAPNKLIAFGGYAVRPPTGEAFLRAFSCIDVVCTGEGEPVIETLASASTDDLALSEVPGILYKQADGTICASASAPPIDMNCSPAPNYDDFFADLKTLSELHQIEVKPSYLPIENSRGCWWGQKKHCVFCGIHDDDLVYRSRTGSRALEVLDSLANRYGFNTFRFSDYILPYRYYQTLLPELARRGKPYRITSEMKANVNAQRFARLASAGFTEVQPGIESFSSNVLRKMDKGVSAIQNIYTLLLGKSHNVTVHYNLLYGFPDDEEQEYEAIVKSLPRLFHLDPPASRVPVQITRYAPLQINPKRFNIPPATYEPSYELIFSETFIERSGFDLNDFCYYFDRSFENSPRLNRLYRKIDYLIDMWKVEQAQREVYLWYEDEFDGLRVFDSRCQSSIEVHLNRAEACAYLAALEPTLIENLRRHYTELTAREDFDAVVERLDRLGLIFQEEGYVIGLALPRKVYACGTTQRVFD